MHTKNFVVYNRGDRHVIKYFRAIFPNVQRTIFPYALIVKTINLSDQTRLMVSSEQSDSIFVANLKCQQ